MPSDPTRGGESPAGERSARRSGGEARRSDEVTSEEQGWLAGAPAPDEDATESLLRQARHAAPGGRPRTFWKFGG